MPKLYVFGIGGTGSRVLRSLTMLLAAGVETNGYEIVPIIIDPDVANADLTRNIEILRKYKAIHDELEFTEGSKLSFFRTKLNPGVDDYTISLRETNDKTYEEFISLEEMDVANKAMAMMLFSEANLKSDMRVGFKGNPNIGSVVLSQIFQTKEFNDFASSFGEEDRIFIISSIFGGTGASGFPLFLKQFRGENNKKFVNSERLRKAEIGAITVLPYFLLDQDEESAIDSSTFMSKTRAALRYYDDNIKDEVDVLYYIGDNAKNKVYDNSDGGATQENDANLIEVLAATAIIDFCQNSKDYEREDSSAVKAKYKEFGLIFGENCSEDEVTLQNFGGICNNSFDYRKNFVSPLIEFALFAKSLVQDYKYVSSQNLKANSNLKSKEAFYNENFVRNVRGFLSEYISWLSELKENLPSFVPFNFESGNLADLKNLVRDLKKVKKSFFSFSRDVDEDSFRSELNGVSPKGNSDKEKFMEIYNVAAKKFASDKYKF